MASLNLNRKRRRVDQSALFKPFKSPLRRPTATSKEEERSSSDKKDITPTNSTPQAHSTGTNTAHDQSPAIPSISPASTSTSLTTSAPFRKRRIPGERLTTAKKAMLLDPEISSLQKQERTLQSRLSALRSELDTVQQALRIESTNKGHELETLIAKWKAISQNAADETFSGAQERVTRMGGIKAWRERTKSDNSRWEEEEMESWFGNSAAEGADLDLDELENRKAEMKAQVEETSEVQDVCEEDVGEPEEFTMDVMLKTLNIDPKTIGFDRSMQRWIKG